MFSRLIFKPRPSAQTGNGRILRLFLLLVFVCQGAWAQSPETAGPGKPQTVTTDEWNARLRELWGGRDVDSRARSGLFDGVTEYRIGPEDVLNISVFEAADFNKTVRVSASGMISLPLLGAVRAAGLSARELEFVLQELLRRTFLKDPHVSVYVAEVQSHPVAVFGAVQKPGVYQIRGTRKLVEVLSMAEGLAEDAGDVVRVMRGQEYRVVRDSEAPEPDSESEQPADPGADRAGPPSDEELRIDLGDLLESGDPRLNVEIYPGDTVTVTKASIVYVIGGVNQAGGYQVKTNEKVSVLQALALAQGLSRTASKGDARIIRTDKQTGGRSEIALNIEEIMKGKSEDPILEDRDILFVPDSTTKAAVYRTLEAVVTTVSGLIVFRR